MGILATWAATQGLDSSKRALQELIGSQSLEQRLAAELQSINAKLDLLIGAPYREAQLFLLEGNVDKAKERAVAAIALNEFDLPAKLLYCLLLARTNRPTRCLDYFEEILRDFGPHRHLVPNGIIGALGDCVHSSSPLRDITPFSAEVLNDSNRNDYLLGEAALYYRPIAIYCSLSALIVRWEIEPGKTWMGSPRFGAHFYPRLCIYDWAGKHLANIRIDNVSSWEVLVFSEKYVVILQKSLWLGREGILIYRVIDGSIVTPPFTPSRDRISRLFASEEIYWVSRKGAWPEPSINLRYCGARLQSQPHGPLLVLPD